MKHEPISLLNLVATCLTCGKKQTLRAEMMAKVRPDYVPFIEEECYGTLVHVYPTSDTTKSELQVAFEDLMKEFPSAKTS